MNHESIFFYVHASFFITSHSQVNISFLLKHESNHIGYVVLIRIKKEESFANWLCCIDQIINRYNVTR